MLDSHKKVVITIVVAVVAIVIFIFSSGKSADKEDSANLGTFIHENERKEGESIEEASTVAIVDVKGEVARPGVYEIDINSRVDDVVQMAGGFTEDAFDEQINLAQKVQDEMIIHVQKVDEISEDMTMLEGTAYNDTIRVNYASQEEIENLNGVGPSKAQAIIQYREEHGLFQTPEELMEVPGIGEKTFENLQDQIQIP